MIWALFAAGCLVTPAEVDKEDVKRATAQQRGNVVCVGLTMPDMELQTYATEQIRTFDAESAAECICQNLKDESGAYREAVVEGMKGEDRNSVVQCLLDVVSDSAVPNRAPAIRALEGMHAPIILPAMTELAKKTGDDSEARAAAVYAIGRNEKSHDVLLELAGDSDAQVQAEAVRSLGNHDYSSLARKVIKGHLTNTAPAVRAAAIEAWRQQKDDDADAEICPMLADEAVSVRKAALMSFKFTRSAEGVKCLRERAMTLEEDADLRDSMLYILKNARGDAKPEAYKVLCDAIPFWLRNYVKDKRPEDLPGTEIVQAQNDVDYEQSLECIKNAYQRSAGYSCYAKEHIATWYGHVSGNDKLNVPECPDYEDDADAQQ